MFKMKKDRLKFSMSARNANCDRFVSITIETRLFF